MSYKLIMWVPINDVEVPFQFDKCSPPRYNQNARFAEQPIQTGETVSDHMWIQPSAFTIEGAFSLSGSWKQYTDNFSVEWITSNNTALDNTGLKFTSDRLANVEELFRWIQRNAVLVRVTFSETDNNGSATASSVTRFTSKNNLAIESLSWVEGYQAVQVTVGYKEIALVSTDQFQAIADALMPMLSLPSTKSVSEVMQETNTLASQIIKALLDEGYIDAQDALCFAEFNNWVSINNPGGWTRMLGGYEELMGWLSAIGGVVVAILAKTGVIALMTAGTTAAAVPVAGWIVTGVIAVIVGIIAINKGAEKRKKAKNLKKGFNLMKHYGLYFNKDGTINSKMLEEGEVNEEDLMRLKDLLDHVANAINQAASNISVYSITTDETDNESRQFTLPVGSSILNLTINKAPAKSRNPFTISYEEYATPLGATPSPGSCSWSPCSSFNSLREIMCIYKNRADGSQLYLLSLDPVNTDKLKSYALLVYTGSAAIDVTVNNLSEVIIDAMENWTGWKE